MWASLYLAEISQQGLDFDKNYYTVMSDSQQQTFINLQLDIYQNTDDIYGQFDGFLGQFLDHFGLQNHFIEILVLDEGNLNIFSSFK